MAMITVCLDVCVCSDVTVDSLHIRNRGHVPFVSTGKSLLDGMGILGSCGAGFVPRSVKKGRIFGNILCSFKIRGNNCHCETENI